jgi:hypothetical protein
MITMAMRKESRYRYMRSLHRDIGFFVIGLTMIYSVSGIVLTYRDTNFLKNETFVTKIVSPNLKANEIGRALHEKKLKVVKEEGEIIYFTNGTYNKVTGAAAYSSKRHPVILEKLNKLHKVSSKDSVHWFTIIYGMLLFFLAISSFWMFKPGTKLFKRGVCFATTGVFVVMILLVL